jgi:hypothetical protein
MQMAKKWIEFYGEVFLALALYLLAMYLLTHREGLWAIWFVIDLTGAGAWTYCAWMTGLEIRAATGHR